MCALTLQEIFEALMYLYIYIYYYDYYDDYDVLWGGAVESIYNLMYAAL